MMRRRDDQNQVRIWFRETPGFTGAVDEYFGGDEGLRLLQLLLARDPEAGAVIQGCGGARKLRWPDMHRAKGKRGGLRIVYLYVPAVRNILLIDVYNEDEAQDLSSQDKREIRSLVNEYRHQVLVESRIHDETE